ncbi:unnamed protein product [Pedinophyceae sp. YPF-701]|nr:unnamed protein product [Pedinophyceae sp. YPF-701]
MSTGRDLLPDILSMLTKIHAGLQQQRQTGPDDGQPLADLLMDSATLGKLTAMSDAADAVPGQETAQPDAACSVSVPDTQVDDWSGHEGSETSDPVDSQRQVPDRLRPPAPRPADRDACPAKLILWPAALRAADRQAAYFRRNAVKPPPGAVDSGRVCPLGVEGNAKLTLLTYSCTAVDALLALCRCESMPRLTRKYNDIRNRRGPFAAAMAAAADVEAAFADHKVAFHMMTKLMHTINDMRAACDRKVRNSALAFTVVDEASGTHRRRAFRVWPGSSGRKCELCPCEDLEDQVTFERLVAAEDGGLQLGAGSLLRRIATTWVSAFRRQWLLLADQETGELRVTPAVLAGLLVEAKEMCTPAGQKSAVIGRDRSAEHREMFDTYVRPLMSQPDGGGVLLPKAQLATWLDDVGALPAAFRAPKEKLPGCLGPKRHGKPYEQAPVPESAGGGATGGQRAKRASDRQPGHHSSKQPRLVIRDYRGIIRERVEKE